MVILVWMQVPSRVGDDFIAISWRHLDQHGVAPDIIYDAGFVIIATSQPKIKYIEHLASNSYFFLL